MRRVISVASCLGVCVQMGKADSKDNQPNIENMLGGAAGMLNEVSSANKDSDYAFSLQVWPKNGKEQWQKMEQAQQRTNNLTSGYGRTNHRGHRRSCDGVAGGPLDYGVERRHFLFARLPPIRTGSREN